MLKNYASNAKVLDLQVVFERFAMDSVCLLVFGEDPACLEADSNMSYYSSKFADAFKEAEKLSAIMFSLVYGSSRRDLILGQSTG